MVKPRGDTRRSGRGLASDVRAVPRRVRRLGAAIMLLGAAWVIMPGQALAQSAPSLNQVPQGSPIPRMLPPAAPSTAPGTALPALPPPGGEIPNRTVHVVDVTVDGVTAFPVAEIQRYAQDLTGPAVNTPLRRTRAASTSAIDSSTFFSAASARRDWRAPNRNIAYARFRAGARRVRPQDR